MAILYCLPTCAVGQAADLFATPPQATKPKVLWEWAGGLLSKDGIARDLQALAQQGIGGVMIMQMPDQAPWPVTWSYRDYPGKVKVLSDEWFDIVNFAIGEADRLGLTVEMFMCPGWNYAASPKLPADKGVKILSHTKTTVTGGGGQVRSLPKPPVGNVSYWTIASWHKDYGREQEFKRDYHSDVAVLATPHGGSGGSIELASVIDLTDRLDAEGNVSWSAPEGEWDIWRISMVSGNHVNHPTPIEAIGLESDRMDPLAIRQVFDDIVGRIHNEAKAKGYKAFIGFETDSYESGYQDFSPDFAQEFLKRRGYDCIPWLPAWTDRHVIIESEQLTSRFKMDMMRTISELWSERFFGTLAAIAKENDLVWKIEPYFGVPLDWRTIAQQGQSGNEFWVTDNELKMVGAAHEAAILYGQNVIWAEAFTAEPQYAAWKNSPHNLKRVADFAYSKGINDFYMHGFHQNSFPDEYQPGVTMGYWGTNLSRHLTWWPFSSGWHTYLARCAYMLRQGVPVADALVYPGTMERIPGEPTSKYRLVTVTDDVLMDKLTVVDGQLSLPHGQRFQALILNEGISLRHDALRRIKELVKQGATLIGNPPPPYSASLTGYPESDNEVRKLIGEIWDGLHPLGKVVPLKGAHRDSVLSAQIGMPDFVGGELLSAHRRLDDGELFFITNQYSDLVVTNASFDVAGLKPEWWNPVDGTIKAMTGYSQTNGRTVLELTLGAYESGFVVFRKKTAADAGPYAAAKAQQTLQTLSGPWQVSFDTRWGGPGRTEFQALEDWSKNSDPGIHYYSGTAIYRKTFDAVDANASILDLGAVHDIAEVTLNGKSLGTVWCAPWQVTIPKGILKKGRNMLEIRVANSWANRLIGDEQEPEDSELIVVNETGDRTGGYTAGVVGRGLKDLPDWLVNRTPRPSANRKTFTTWRYYNREAPLVKSGLLGPVSLRKQSPAQN